MTMRIRQAEAADFDAVQSITRETIQAVYPRYYPKGAVDFFLTHHSDAVMPYLLHEIRVLKNYQYQIT